MRLSSLSFACSLLAVSACAHTSEQTSSAKSLQILADMEGSSSATVIAVLGEPTRVSHMDGSVHYIWLNERGLMNETSDYIQESYSTRCKTEVITDTDDIIQSTRMHGHYEACRKFVAPLNRYVASKAS